MKTHLCLIASIVFASLPQAGAQNNFHLSLGDPNNVETIKSSMIFANNGVSATAKAWSISRTESSAKFQTSQVVQWAPGLGVKNSTETITNVPYVPYYVDNQDHYDFVLFVFDTTVDLTSLSVSPSGNSFDTDVSYWFGNVNTNVSLTGQDFTNLASLGFGSRIDNNASPSTSNRTFSMTTPEGGVNALLVGAKVGGDSDFDRFKLVTISGKTVPAAVPEPATTGLFALGLMLVIGRRRR